MEKYIVRQLGLQYLFGLTALKEMERTGDGEGTMKKFDVNMDEAQKKELLATFTNDDDSSLYTSILNGKVRILWMAEILWTCANARHHKSFQTIES